jgi:hypothetical protein
MPNTDNYKHHDTRVNIPTREFAGIRDYDVMAFLVVLPEGIHALSGVFSSVLCNGNFPRKVAPSATLSTGTLCCTGSSRYSSSRTCWPPTAEPTRFITLGRRPDRAMEAVTPRVTEVTGTKLALSRHQVDILRLCMTEQPLLKLLAMAGRSDRTKFRNQVLHPLLAEGLLELTVPDKLRSSKQQYRLTDKGRTMLAQTEIVGR